MDFDFDGFVNEITNILQSFGAQPKLDGRQIIKKLLGATQSPKVKGFPPLYPEENLGGLENLEEPKFKEPKLKWME